MPRRKKRKVIGYEFALDLQERAEKICRVLFPHINRQYFKCFRSRGSSARRTLARCHGLAKIMQKTIGCSAHYAIEFISERFDELTEQEQTKIIIHELMHIPCNFGGGFRHHDHVSDRNVEKLYRNYKKVLTGAEV
ncbi:MAG: metallopeptidase [Candidatus Omnitrophica bacterium]|nr:metallopeptidase [Candidatus Omnitrophota bacterium]